MSLDFAPPEINEKSINSLRIREGLGKIVNSEKSVLKYLEALRKI
jgi:hypothetical protein